MKHIIFVLFLFTSGCQFNYIQDNNGQPLAKDPIKDLEILKNKNNCCASYKEFQFDQLNINETITFVIDHSYPAYAFKDGKSYFKAFQLPKRFNNLELNLTSYFSGETAFNPYLRVLDKDYRVIETYDNKIFVDTDKKRNEPRRVNGTISLKNNTAKYIILSTTDALSEESSNISVTEPGFIFISGGIGAYAPGADSPTLYYGHVGKLKLTIRDIK